MDLTEECGTSVPDQWAVRQEVRLRFPDKPWIDVFSKADLLAPLFQDATQWAQDNLSDNSLTGSSQLDEPVVSVMAHAHGSATAVSSTWDAVPSVQGPVEMAARLPHALRVSSLTEEGISQLQVNIVAMFQIAAQQAREARLAEKAAALEKGPAMVVV
mmetsp:Transcript_16224/g.27868  ORF Transcript_16224/g.27868 Transcript_16224/m.27868 type:complete len:158 (+) Transcript_16224:2-475(+)